MVQSILSKPKEMGLSQNSIGYEFRQDPSHLKIDSLIYKTGQITLDLSFS